MMKGYCGVLGRREDAWLLPGARGVVGGGCRCTTACEFCDSLPELAAGLIKTEGILNCESVLLAEVLKGPGNVE